MHMKRSESELDNAVCMRYSVKEDSAGLDMLYRWTINAYLDRRHTRAVPEFQRGPGRPRTKWRRSTVKKDLLRMGSTWEEAEVYSSSKHIRMASECGPIASTWMPVDPVESNYCIGYCSLYNTAV